MTEQTESQYKIVFVATYPDKNGKSPKFLEDLVTSGYKVLHPAYNYESAEGADMLTYLKLKMNAELPPKDANPWKNLQLRDYFGVKVSSIVVYDTDADPGTHFMAAACIFQKPVIAVSQTLVGVPAYFSGIVSAVLKPEDLVKNLP